MHGYHGCNAFDTADFYSIGGSEFILGEVLKGDKRKEVVVYPQKRVWLW